ncbi:MAG: rod shape-determining protein MreD [Alphaproteobacteria bacterium]
MSANAPLRAPPPGRPEPPQDFARRIEALLRLAFPLLSTAVVLILSATPIGMPALAFALAMPAVAFWTVFRPAGMAPPMVFILGLLLDLLTMAPLGVHIIALLALHGAAMRLRFWLARQGFFLVWLCFWFGALAAILLAWGFTALLLLTLPPWQPVFHTLLLSAGLYPPFAIILSRAHEAMRRAENLP